MNLLKASFDGSAFRIGDAALPFAVDLPKCEVLLGVRAEDLAITTDRAAPGLPLRVDYIEELGPQRLVHGRTGQQPIAVVLGADVPVGDTLTLTARPSALHVFDQATGKRLLA